MSQAKMDRMEFSGRISKKRTTEAISPIDARVLPANYSFAALPDSLRLPKDQQYKKPQSHAELLQQQLQEQRIDTRGMTYEALRAFTVAHALVDNLATNELPTTVHEASSNPAFTTDFNAMVVIGIHHFMRAHEMARGTE